MKYKNSLYLLVILGVFMALSSSCKKKDTSSLPLLKTVAVTDVTEISAKSGGKILNDGGSAIIACGVCWSKTGNLPTIEDDKTVDDNELSFVSEITGLSLHTQYYLRAYATNSNGTDYGQVIPFTTNGPCTIGESFAGGIIFYLNYSGQHGFIASPADYNTISEWGCTGSKLIDYASSNGSGQSNTSAIVNGCNSPYCAARICNDLVINYFDDWFLPSKDELDLMYQKKSIIGGFLNLNYWSSTEVDSNNAYSQNFNNGIQQVINKSSSNQVRAIRAF